MNNELVEKIRDAFLKGGIEEVKRVIAELTINEQNQLPDVIVLEFLLEEIESPFMGFSLN